jgi:hypothetical protein
MNIREELATGLMTGFLISAEYAPAQTDRQNDGMRTTSEASAGEFIVIFGPLAPEIACKVRPYLKATAELAGTRPTTEDLRVQKRALALIAKAIKYIDREGLFADTTIEYREG